MKLEKRTENLKSVRTGHKIPGVLFGKSIEPEAIQIDEKEFNEAFKQYGLTQTFEVKMGRKKHDVYIKEVQRHHINHNQYLNVKLLKVMAGDMIRSNLPINIIGKESIEKPGVIIQHLADSIEVEYGIGENIRQIDVDVSKLEIGDVIKVEDLIIPKGITVLDPMDKPVVNLVETKYQEIEEVEEEVVQEVEIITEKHKE